LFYPSDKSQEAGSRVMEAKRQEASCEKCLKKPSTEVNPPRRDTVLNHLFDWGFFCLNF
jgi:hypothetical protein